MTRLLLKTAGLALCTLPPIAAILTYFPIWVAKGGETVVSGFTLLLLLVALIPFWRVIKRALTSPASYTVWLIAFIAFFALSNIAKDMTVISFVGFIGNLLGAALWKLADKKGEVTDDAKRKV